jgi:two-component system alkaline phosphatase synthesis response regulator PhoP
MSKVGWVTKKKIMVVDDEPDQIYTIKQILEDFSDEYEVIGADSGKECLDMLRNNEIPDLIVLDIMMPIMSGWETLNKLKENSAWRDIPVVFLTARTDWVAKNAGSFLGEDYIEKPIDVEDFKRRIEKVLRNAGRKELI